MSGISAREQMLLGRDYQRTLTDKALLFRPAYGRSSSGGVTTTYPDTPTLSTAAHLVAMGDQIVAYYAEKLGGRQGFVLEVPRGVSTVAGDRWQVGGRTFEAIGSNSGQTNDWLRRVPVKELT